MRSSSRWRAQVRPSKNSPQRGSAPGPPRPGRRRACRSGGRSSRHPAAARRRRGVVAGVAAGACHPDRPGPVDAAGPGPVCSPCSRGGRRHEPAVRTAGVGSRSVLVICFCLQFWFCCLDRFVGGHRPASRTGSGCGCASGWGWRQLRRSARRPPGPTPGPARAGPPGQGEPCGGSARGAGTWAGGGSRRHRAALAAEASAGAIPGAREAEDVQQEGALHLAGPVPARAGKGFGCGQLTGLVRPGRLAHLTPAGGAVLLKPPFGGPAAGLGLRQDPGAAPFGLDLGQPGATAQSVVGQPLRQPPLRRRMLDLPTVRSCSR